MLGWQVNKFNPLGDVIASGMGEFFPKVFQWGFFSWGEGGGYQIPSLLPLSASSQVWRCSCGTETRRWSAIGLRRRRPRRRLTVFKTRRDARAVWAENARPPLQMPSSGRNWLLWKNPKPKPRRRRQVSNKKWLSLGSAKLCGLLNVPLLLTRCLCVFVKCDVTDVHFFLFSLSIFLLFSYMFC